MLLNKAYEQYKAEILHSLAPVEEQLVAVEKALHQFDTECSEISQQTALVEDSIHDTIDKFQKMLDARKTELIGQLHEVAQKKLKGLAAQRDHLEIDQVKLEQCDVEFVHCLYTFRLDPDDLVAVKDGLGVMFDAPKIGSPGQVELVEVGILLRSRIPLLPCPAFSLATPLS